MELVLENPVLLKKSMETISDLVLEGTIVFKPDYMEVVALNSNNVVMIIFRLLSTNFESYNVKENVKVSLSLEHLSNILKSCDDKCSLTLVVGEGSKLKVISGDKNKKEFELSLIDFEDENLQKIPDLKFPIKIVTSSNVFTKAISDLNFLDEGVSFILKNEKFNLEGKNNSLSGKISIDDDIDIKAKDKGEYESRYSMSYLKKFIKAEKIVDLVELSFDKDYPLKVEYKIVDKLLLSFILAPRGED